MRVGGAEVKDSGNVAALVGAHGEYQRTREAPRGHSRHGAYKHGHVAPLRNVAQLKAAAQEGLFKAKGAAQHKAYKVIAPQVPYIRLRACAYALLVDVVLRNVAANVEVNAKLGEAKLTRRGNEDEGGMAWGCCGNNAKSRRRSAGVAPQGCLECSVALGQTFARSMRPLVCVRVRHGLCCALSSCCLLTT